MYSIPASTCPPTRLPVSGKEMSNICFLLASCSMFWNDSETEKYGKITSTEKWKTNTDTSKMLSHGHTLGSEVAGQVCLFSLFKDFSFTIIMQLQGPAMNLYITSLNLYWSTESQSNDYLMGSFPCQMDSYLQSQNDATVIRPSLPSRCYRKKLL